MELLHDSYGFPMEWTYILKLTIILHMFCDGQITMSPTSFFQLLKSFPLLGVLNIIREELNG